MKKFGKLRRYAKRYCEDEDKLVFYDIDKLEEMYDNDELSAEESGFMRGYMQAESV